MRVSDVTAAHVCGVLRLESTQTAEVEPLMDAAKEYIRTYTGLSQADVDTHADIYHAFMCLVADMYDHREFYAEKPTENRTAQIILDKYAVNLVPTDEVPTDD